MRLGAILGLVMTLLWIVDRGDDDTQAREFYRKVVYARWDLTPARSFIEGIRLAWVG